MSLSGSIKNKTRDVGLQGVIRLPSHDFKVSVGILLNPGPKESVLGVDSAGVEAGCCPGPKQPLGSVPTQADLHLESRLVVQSTAHQEVGTARALEDSE